MPLLANRGGWTADGAVCPALAATTDPSGRWRFSVLLPGMTGPWVKALAASGYRAYPVNPKQAARHKETITGRRV